ncbi:spartin-like [Dysidea avara]|uniref:spartin-like n=1 Tax=Dysidea avara TaxID=196820 RepID=UPI00332A768F
MSTVVTSSKERQPAGIYQDVKRHYEDAYKLINEALTTDECGDKQTAILTYRKALQKLSNGISASKGSEPRVKEMKQKMERSHTQISDRLKELTSVTTTSSVRPPPVRPPQPTSKVVVKDATTEQSNKQVVDTKAELLYQISEGVGLFRVNSRGNVVKFEDVDGLNVFCFKERVKGNPPAFLQCGKWIFPLLPGKSPVLKASDCTYMFPELQEDDGCSVGLMLEGATEEAIRKLDMILTSLALLKDSNEVVATVTEEERMEVGVVTPEETTSSVKETTSSVKETTPTTTTVAKRDELPSNWGTTVAAGITTGVEVVSRTVEKGAVLANKAIVMGASKLRERMKPSEQPAEIPLSVQKGVVVADHVTGVVVNVSELLLMSLAKMTVQVGKTIGQAVGDSKMVDTTHVNPDLKEAWKVTKASVTGLARVFSVLQHNATTLLKTSADQTSHTVAHKYGDQAGEVTDKSLRTAGNVTGLVLTYANWKKLGISFLSRVGTVLNKQTDKQQTEDKTTDDK